MTDIVAGSNTEAWRPVVGYEGWYAVSSRGRVRRIRPGANSKLNAPLKPATSQRGYLSVAFSRQSKISRQFVHRVVATAFLGARERGWEVNHKDGVKTNNRVENLEWVTSSQNKSHGYDTGLYANGEGLYNAGFTNEQVREIKRRLADGKKPVEIAREYGVGRWAIGRISRGQSWRRVEP